MEEEENDKEYKFEFNKPEILRPPLFRITNGYFKYNDDEYLLENLNFQID